MNKLESSSNKLTSIPVKSKAWQRARTRAHKKKMKEDCFGIGYSQLSSAYSNTVKKVSNYFPSVSLNKVASAVVVASYIGGIAYAVNNPVNYYGPHCDIPTGLNIAIGTSFITCCLTSTIQRLRGNKLDADAWVGVAVATALSSLPFISEIKPINKMKADIHRYNVEYPELAGQCQFIGPDVTGSRINALECHLLQSAKIYIDKGSGHVEGLERSYAGASGVYFPQDVPVVLKVDHHRKNVKKIEEVKKVCLKNNYYHLTIPKASYYKGYSVHTLISAPRFDELAIMKSYYENKKAFNRAVKEFTGFLCQVHMSDLMGHCAAGISQLPRLDNAMPYLDEHGIGKIALMDLDDAKPASFNVDLSGQIDLAVRFFPNHLEEILDAAKKFHPNIESKRDHLENVQREALNVYETMYGKHATFVKMKGITFANPEHFPPLTDEVKLHIQKGVIEELKNYNDKNSQYSQSFKKLNENIDDSLKVIDNVLPQIIDQTLAFIAQKLKDNAKEKCVNSHVEILKIRRLSFDSIPQLKENILLLKELPEIQYVIADYLFVTILKELAKAGGLAQANYKYKLVLQC